MIYEGDSGQFTNQDTNAKRICNAINASEKAKALTTAEYYTATTGKDPALLSKREWARFDRKNGDIIIVDDKNNALCKIDLKVSQKYTGSVALGSVVDFDNGLYLCVNIGKGTYTIVTHEDVVNLAKSGKIYPPAESRSYKGFPVMWEGQRLTSEYYVRGSDIERL